MWSVAKHFLAYFGQQVYRDEIHDDHPCLSSIRWSMVNDLSLDNSETVQSFSLIFHINFGHPRGTNVTGSNFFDRKSELLL